MSIPTEKLVGWFNDNSRELGEEKRRLQGIQERGADPSHPSFAGALGKIVGKQEILHSFEAFITTEAADAAGKLDVSTLDD